MAPTITTGVKGRYRKNGYCEEVKLGTPEDVAAEEYFTPPDTLFHINWGDGDNFFVIAPDEATAKERMPDGRDMVNTIVSLDHLYNLIFNAGDYSPALKCGASRDFTQAL